MFELMGLLACKLGGAPALALLIRTVFLLCGPSLSPCLQLIAASTDTEETHLAWIRTSRKKGGLGYMQIPIVADTTKEIAARWAGQGTGRRDSRGRHATEGWQGGAGAQSGACRGWRPGGGMTLGSRYGLHQTHKVPDAGEGCWGQQAPSGPCSHVTGG